MQGTMPGTLSMLCGGLLMRSCPRLRVRPANKHGSKQFLIHCRYRHGGYTNTLCESFFSATRRDACHRKFHGQGENFFVSPTYVSYSHQEAISLAALVKEQLQCQVLPPTEIPVPKSLVIPMGTDVPVRKTRMSMTLTSTRKKLYIPIFGG